VSGREATGVKLGVNRASKLTAKARKAGQDTNARIAAECSAAHCGPSQRA
jgi:hypothetical protein